MDDKQSSYERIEGYLSGSLSISETKIVEQELANNPELRQEFHLHREIQASVLDQDAEQVAQKIKTVGQDFVQSRKTLASAKQGRLWKRPLAIAAGIAFLIAIIFLLKFYKTTAASSQQLYANNYTVPALLTISRSDTNTSSKALANAYQSYEAKKYSEAIAYFSIANQESPLSITDQYYQAVCHLAKVPSDTDQSIALFQVIIDQGNNNYVYAAHWYIAMAYLKKDQMKEAKRHLSIIKDEGNGKYKPKAQKLLQEMN